MVAPQRAAREAAAAAAAAAAWGLLGQAASPEEEGAGQEAGEGAGRGWTKGLAAAEATWMVGPGSRGLDQAAPANPPRTPSAEGRRCAGGSRLGVMDPNRREAGGRPWLSQAHFATATSPAPVLASAPSFFAAPFPLLTPAPLYPFPVPRPRPSAASAGMALLILPPAPSPSCFPTSHGGRFALAASLPPACRGDLWSRESPR